MFGLGPYCLMRHQLSEGNNETNNKTKQEYFALAEACIASVQVWLATF